jgi:hypothetical protein
MFSKNGGGNFKKQKNLKAICYVVLLVSLMRFPEETFLVGAMIFLFFFFNF